MGKAYFDHEPVLRHWCKTIQPKRVLEWGPGFSTQVFQSEAPDAEIRSIEHNPAYFDKMRREHPYAKIEHIPINANAHCLYATMPISRSWGLFDIVFIDGRRRMECLMAACVVVAHHGVIIMHDAERKEYQLRHLITRTIGGDKRTAVMKPYLTALDVRTQVGEAMVCT